MCHDENKIIVWQLMPKQLVSSSILNINIIVQVHCYNGLKIEGSILQCISCELKAYTWNQQCYNEEQPDGEWISTQLEQQHTLFIGGLILNSSENELISCSWDKTIKIWKVDCLSNQQEYKYILDQKHTQQVDCISMNEKETYLVSCSRDKKIILWKKDNQNKWKYLNEIVNDDNGRKLCFISDYQIVWQQYGKGISHFFEIKNEQLIERSELNIQLNEESEGHYLFPTIFNKRKQIIVQSHNQYVYLLKKQENDSYILASDPIDCQNSYNYGSLTYDGEYLIVWNSGTYEFRVHKIHYK